MGGNLVLALLNQSLSIRVTVNGEVIFRLGEFLFEFREFGKSFLG